MNLKSSLILLTIVSVIADTMLLPFYPQFFQQAFHYDNPQHVGFYIAACCFTVMCAFPLWAKVAKRIHELHLWVITQIIACGLGIACFYSTSLIEFWLLSQTMLAFKASYLLIYPFVMRLEEKDKHLGMVGLFSVLMHFGAIGGAMIGGYVLQFFNPKDIYLIMAASDALQVLVCVYLISSQKIHWQPVFDTESASNTVTKSAIESTKERNINRFILKLGIVTALFYFSAFLIRPFFTRYWQSFNEHLLATDLATGFVYSIPGWIALLGLWVNHKYQHKQSSFQVLINAMLLGLVGLLIQSAEQTAIVILGRCVFGWALFQATVRMEVILFEVSVPERYGSDFSKVHFMQNLGIIASSFAVGSIVSQLSYQWTFYLAAAGFLITLFVFYTSFKSPAKRKTSRAEIQDHAECSLEITQ